MDINKLLNKIPDNLIGQVFRLESEKQVSKYAANISRSQLINWHNFAILLSNNNGFLGSSIMHLIEQHPDSIKKTLESNMRVVDMIRCQFESEFGEAPQEVGLEVYRCIVRLIWVVEILAKKNKLPSIYIDCTSLFSTK